MQTTPSNGFNSNLKMQAFIAVCYIDTIKFEMWLELMDWTLWSLKVTNLRDYKAVKTFGGFIYW